VVYGHTPVLESILVNRTINIDTGCVFGGRLTALRYPELEVRWVVSKKAYASQRRGGFDPAFQERLARRHHDVNCQNQTPDHSQTANLGDCSKTSSQAIDTTPPSTPI
jgi:hypothetical protein